MRHLSNERITVETISHALCSQVRKDKRKVKNKKKSNIMCQHSMGGKFNTMVLVKYADMTPDGAVVDVDGKSLFILY